jgi:dihydroorotate dehydrogenase
MRAEDARAKIAAGADLVQLYTGLIYRGPALVTECAAALADTRSSHPTTKEPHHA